MARHIAMIVPAAAGAAAGGNAYNRRQAERLRQAGHAVHVIEVGAKHPLPDAEAKASASEAWRALPEDALPVIDGLVLAAFADVADALAARAVGLVHHPSALQHGLPDPSRAALRAIEHRILPRLPKVIATSQACGERLQSEFDVASDRIAVVVPGTDDAPRSVGSGGPDCAILSVGSLVPRKGHDVLLRALARLFDLDWSLTIAGSATRDPVCARGLGVLAEELGIAQRVRFAGEVDDASLEQLWRGADLFALATRWEGYAMAVAEALKRGLPVALAAGEAVTKSVPTEAGVICPPGDHEGLSKAMRRLIFDADLRRYMSERAWEAGRKLPDWPTQARAFAAALA